MNTIDERLKHAADMETRGVTAETLRPLKLPARHRPRIDRRLSGPFLVAAAVAATVALALWAAQALRPADGNAPISAPGGPPHYVAVDKETGKAAVYDADTGRKITGIGPAGRRYSAVAAAGDRRTFYLAAQVDRCTSKVYRMRLGPNGSVGSLTLVTAESVPTKAERMAVTTDGGRLAITNSGDCKHGVLVVETVSGFSHDATVNASYHGMTPSWAADGRTLVLVRENPPADTAGEIAVIDAPAVASVGLRNVVHPSLPDGGTVDYGVADPDGRFATVTVQGDKHGPGDAAAYTVRRISLATGRPVRTLAQVPYRGWEGFTADATGTHFLARVGQDLVRIDDGRVHRLWKNTPWIDFAW